MTDLAATDEDPIDYGRAMCLTILNSKDICK